MWYETNIATVAFLICVYQYIGAPFWQLEAQAGLLPIMWRSPVQQKHFLPKYALNALHLPKTPAKMYVPEQYKNEDKDELLAFIEAHSFGILVTNVAGKPWATHIPLELARDAEGRDLLYGHVSRANPQGPALVEGQTALAIFSGPHAYISSSWYGHENVPTWNYVAVHVYGRIILLDEEELLASLKALVDKHERSMAQPIKLENLSEETMLQVQGVVGFKIIIEDIQAAYKLSQNRNDEDYGRIVHELGKCPHHGTKELADLMTKMRGGDS
jgi:transcriptional regulator